MTVQVHRFRYVTGIVLGAVLLLGSVTAGTDLLVDGDFEACPNGATLRRDDRGQDWYESRKNTPEGRRLLKFSTRDIEGNATHKAMIKGHPELNTYLTQRFAEPQQGRLWLQYDILLREILPDDNRSAFCFVGASNDNRRGPNSSDKERFVFLGFENAEEEGLLNLCAREKRSGWRDRTVVARGLEPHRWYTINLEIDIPEEVYRAQVVGASEPVELEAYRRGWSPLDELTHVTFASWDDGAGTFYVDNVTATAD